MGAHRIKNGLVFSLQIKRPYVTGHVDASIFLVFPPERMIAKGRVKRIFGKYAHDHLQFLAQFRTKFFRLRQKGFGI